MRDEESQPLLNRPRDLLLRFREPRRGGSAGPAAAQPGTSRTLRRARADRAENDRPPRLEERRPGFRLAQPQHLVAAHGTPGEPPPSALGDDEPQPPAEH